MKKCAGAAIVECAARLGIGGMRAQRVSLCNVDLDAAIPQVWELTTVCPPGERVAPRVQCPKLALVFTLCLQFTKSD